MNCLPKVDNLQFYLNPIGFVGKFVKVQAMGWTLLSVQVVDSHLHFGTLRCRLGGSFHPIAYIQVGIASGVRLVG
jgi:hypothetical protein